jgi:hypothetical protein
MRKSRNIQDPGPSRKKGLIVLFAAFSLTAARSQVVNIENRRLQTDSVRTAGNGNFAFLLNSTNGRDILTFRGNILVQHKSRDLRQIWLFNANYDLAKAEKESFVNNFYVHLRYNYKINDRLRWEAFLQHQRNLPLGIESRQLAGTGPRFKFKLGRNAELYLATAVMYEHERTIKPESAVSNDIRSSSYASLNIRFPKSNGSIVSTSYFQPLFRDVNDARVMNDTRISFNITSKWQVYTNFSYFNDSRPPAGIRRSALNLEQGFGFSF